MSDVTCRLIIDQLAFLEEQGVPTAGLRQTLAERWERPDGKQPWFEPTSRISWNQFAYYCREVESFFSPDLERLFVERTLNGPSQWVDVVRPLLKAIVDPLRLYFLLNNWLGPWAFRNVQAHMERTGPGALRIELGLRPEDDECQMFFRITNLMLEQMPRIVGCATAVVSASCKPKSATYVVILPPRLPFWALLRRRIKAVFASKALFTELAQRETELHLNSIRLLETQTILEEAVRERTAELERTNRQLVERVATVQRLERIGNLGSWTWHLEEPRRLVWSEETYRLFGIDPSVQPTPEVIAERIHPDDLPAVRAANDRCRLLGLPMENDHRVVLPDGTIRWIAQRGEVIRDEQGQPARVIGTSFDVTLHKRYEQSLIAAKEASDAANRTKSTFLANVSHEIRTPMSSVLGFAELLSTQDLSPEKHQSYINKILRNGRHLLTLIDDVLDLSKIEAGHLIIQPIRFSPQAEVTQALDLLRGDADKKGIRLTTNWDGEFPSEIQNDPIRFRQIVINIVGNAVKYTDQGEVRLTSRSVGNQIEITVEDSGPGIAPEFADSLFQPFSQAKPHAQKRSGSGLGLALARQLARALGGDVDLVRSNVGGGTTFAIRIARDLPQDPRQNSLLLENGITIRLDVDQALAGFPRGAKILIAEDNPDIQELVRRVLEAAGAKVTTANNGMLALKATKEARFDLIFMDMQMPEVDGFQATAQLRRDGFQSPIVALTAFAMSGERQKCFAAGCNDFLAKPVESLILIKTVAKWVKAPVA